MRSLNRCRRVMSMGILSSPLPLRAAIACACIAGLLPATALAHPHAWIDLHVKLLADDEQHVHALSQTWVFDPVYTMILIEEVDEEQSDDDRAERLQRMGQRMIGNMAEYDYLTRIAHGDDRLRAEGVRDIDVQVNASEQLEFRFTLDLPRNVNLRQQPLHYMIYDPVYYIEMLHPSSSAVSLNGNSERCTVNITAPDPDPSQIARAAAVDLGAADPDGLGRHFAEQVTIRCQDQ